MQTTYTQSKFQYSPVSGEGKTVIITGANGNLGAAVIQTFLEKNYTVVATVATEGAKSDMPVHNNLKVQAVNLTSEEETAVFTQNAISKYKEIDAALLLVGGFAMGNIGTTAIADIYKQFSINFDTAYHVVRPLFQHMLHNGRGRIIFIGARPALEAAAGKQLLAYGLSKSLLFKLAEYLNEEAKGKNIVTTVVVPSTLDTALNRSSMPGVNPDNWVKPAALAEILEFVVSDTATALRETILKVYNNA